MNVKDNEIHITLPPVPHDENIILGEETLPEYTGHHDFGYVLEETFMNSNMLSGDDLYHDVSRVSRALSFDFPDDSPEVEAIEVDGFSPTSAHGHISVPSGHAVTHNPCVRVQIIDLTPLLDCGITHEKLEEAILITLSEMGVSPTDSALKVNMSPQITDTLSDKNVALQQSLKQGVVMTSSNLLATVAPPLLAKDLHVDYPLGNEMGFLTVHTIDGRDVNLPVLSEEMYKKMCDIGQISSINVFPEGSQMMAMPDFLKAVEGRVLGVNPKSAHRAPSLIPTIGKDGANKPSVQDFCQEMAKNLRYYQHINGVAEAFNTQLSLLAPSDKHRASWTSEVLRHIPGKDKAANPDVYAEISDNKEALSVKLHDKSPQVSGMKRR